MRIRFSRHARRQMKWGKITEDEIKATIKNPDKLEDTIKRRKNVFKKIEDRLLKITYRTEGDDVIVITAMEKGES